MSQFHQKFMENKKRPSINISLFTTFTESFSIEKPTTKSPRNFENGGVGLGIVAAMNDSSNTHVPEFAKVSNLALSPRSNPIPIVSSAKAAANFRGRGGVVADEGDEGYTCVISHVGNNVIKKHVYYGDETGDFHDGSIRVFDVNPGLFYASTSPMFVSMNNSYGGKERSGFCKQDFLASCYLCNKLLHGLDIFMYRGEKAFCSADCREKHIRSDHYKDKCRGEARKKKAHDYSISPCSSPQMLSAGVVAA